MDAHVYFATSREHRNLTPDDRVAADALAAVGIATRPLVWSETPPMSLDPHSVIVIRSCWDYHLHPEDFTRWLTELVRVGVAVLNPVGVLRWNLHKRYLLQLAGRGVPIVPTRWVQRGDTRSLEGILEHSRWEQVVVKPAVSLSAHQTWRSDRSSLKADEDRFASLLAEGDVLVQEFIPEIEHGGEWSLVFIGGEYSHAVRKVPKRGDFRVQTDHGGSALPDVAPTRLIQESEHLIRGLPQPLPYARLDWVLAGDHPLLMEAECIDPDLFFQAHPAAATRFAETIRSIVIRLRHSHASRPLLSPATSWVSHLGSAHHLARNSPHSG